MARVNKKPKDNYRAALRFPPSDAALINELRQALALERGGPVTVSETIRDALRFRAKKRGIELSA